VDQLLAEEAVDDVFTAGEVLWPLADHQQSVRDVVSRNPTTGLTVRRKHTEFDSFGKVTDEVFFDQSGTPIVDPQTHAEAIDQVFGYTGRALDESTGLSNNLHRWYDAAVGRWISEDPIWDDTNRYRYVGNTPISKVDPSGLEDVPLSVALGQLSEEEREELIRDLAELNQRSAGIDSSPFAYGPPGRRRVACVPYYINGRVVGSMDMAGSSDNSGVQQGLVELGKDYGEVGASFVPGVGEVQDAAVIADPDSTWLAWSIALVSLGVSYITGGFSPNAGGILRATDDVVEAGGDVARVAPNQIRGPARAAIDPNLRELAPGVSRTAAENAAAREFYRNNRLEAIRRWEQRTGQQWPRDADGNFQWCEHPRALANGGDPLHVRPGIGPDPNAPHMVRGPDGLTDQQRWGAMGPPARRRRAD
jgi:RHS repeat-associated protein